MLNPVWQDLMHLYSAVRLYRPRHVLELGSGWSTVVMAGALIQNDVGDLESWESESVYLSEMVRFTSSRVLYCPVRTIVHPETGVKTFDYEMEPASMIDLLYVDGPRHIPDCYVTLTPVRLEPWLNPGGRIIVDGRRFTVDYLREHLTRNYKIDTEHDTTTFEVLL
jgi:predicted O-methyltransferase YrrM